MAKAPPLTFRSQLWQEACRRSWTKGTSPSIELLNMLVEAVGADPDESRCAFCHRVTRPWLTSDEVWALVEPTLGQGQACLSCFYDALPEDLKGEPLVVRLNGRVLPHREETG